jgi:hypothetical protein
MMEKLFLTKQELKELTDESLADKQIMALRSLGIYHRILPDKSIKVLREHVKQQFGAEIPKGQMIPRIEPNFGALRNA